jgi:hypothetical protein
MLNTKSQIFNQKYIKKLTSKTKHYSLLYNLKKNFFKKIKHLINFRYQNKYGTANRNF